MSRGILFAAYSLHTKYNKRREAAANERGGLLCMPVII